jgi:class 3 adenylate cyclase
LFADIVGSTALGERLPPEEVKALVGECVTRMSAAVEEFGGMVQAYMGDGICAYFGVPAAHEDDPERAARAALRIVQIVGDYSRDVAVAWDVRDFNVRVGINSGPTAVGQVGGGGGQTVALGDTTNVAARLQAAAAPGTITVGDGAAKLLAHRFALETLGELSLKGRQESILAWRLIQPRQVAQAPARAPLVGREAEVERLRRAVDELVDGRGQVVLLTGDAGLGKTRLLNELQAVAGEQVTWLEGQCPSYGGGFVYWPFVEMLRSWLGIGEGEAAVATRTRLRARLGALLPEALPALGNLLGVQSDARQEPRDDLSAREAFRMWVEALSRDAPVLIAVEDLHWSDHSTRLLAEDLLSLTEVTPVLVAGTLRPDPGSEGWALRLRVLSDFAHRSTELALSPLGPDDSAQLLSVLLPGLDETARREIAERAEGNPLYLQELLRALVEGGGLERGRTWTLTVKASQLLPPALENLLVARIDRLPEGARQLAQAGAVIGRTFAPRVAEQVAGLESGGEELGALFRAGILRETRRVPELECSFTHGLFQEAALSTLTPARVEGLAGRAAAAYETLSAGTGDEYLELLAELYARSRDLAKALVFLERAGERAASLGAHDEAVELWRRAAKMAGRVGDSEAQLRIEQHLR